MKAMLLKSHADINTQKTPFSLVQLPEPTLASGEVLIRITACGGCHTEIDEIEGRIRPRLPIILGHQVVGIIEECSNDFSRYRTTEVVTTGMRVGVAWIASACGTCQHCLAGNENLCAEFKATGRDIDGGYAEYVKVPVQNLISLPESIGFVEAAAFPLPSARHQDLPAAAGGLPFYAILCLPILFAAGMSLLDTIDGAFMNFAYGWAFSRPVRKVFYNITITALSVAVALIIGTVELLAVFADKLNLSGGLWDFVSHLDLNAVGYFIAGLFLATWVLALAVWRLGRIEERWSARLDQAAETGVQQQLAP